MLELPSRLFMPFQQENQIQPMVSHQKMSIPHDSGKDASERDNDVVICLKMVNQGHVDKTAQGFNQSQNQRLKSHFPW